MGFETQAISAQVTKQIVTIFSKTCDNTIYCYMFTWTNIIDTCIVTGI